GGRAGSAPLRGRRLPWAAASMARAPKRNASALMSGLPLAGSVSGRAQGPAAVLGRHPAAARSLAVGLPQRENPRMADSRHLVDEARAASRARFARLVARPEPEIELALGALIIAGHGRAPIDEPGAFDRLDSLADHVRLRIDAGDADDVVLDRLHDVL